MIGIALVEVTYLNEQSYKHRHTWMSEGPLHAPVELMDWKRETEKEQKCTLEVKAWTLKERSDIGY